MRTRWPAGVVPYKDKIDARHSLLVWRARRASGSLRIVQLAADAGRMGERWAIVDAADDVLEICTSNGDADRMLTGLNRLRAERDE